MRNTTITGKSNCSYIVKYISMTDREDFLVAGYCSAWLWVLPTAVP